MPIQAQSADGKIHEFPDGTDPKIVDRVMGEYAKNAQPQTPPEDERSWGDALKGGSKAVGSGALHEGVPGILGMARDLPDMISSGMRHLSNKARVALGSTPITDEEYEKMSAPPWGLPDIRLPGSETIKKAITKIVPEYEPKTKTEEYLKTVGGFAPQALLAPGGAGIRTLATGGIRSLPQAAREMTTALGQYAVAPGIASEGAGQLAEGTDYELPARIAGSIMAPSVARTLVTPNPTKGITPAAAQRHRELVDELRNEHGVTSMTPSQISNNPTLAATEAKLADTGWSGTSTRSINQLNEHNVTRAALQHGGVNADVATPQVMREMHQNLNREFNTLTAAHQMPFEVTGVGTQTSRQVKRILRDYENNALEPIDRPKEIVKRMEDQAAKSGGWLTGRQYQNFRSQLGELSSSAHNDPPLMRTLASLRNTLDDAMERTIRTAAPDNVGRFQAAREMYRNKLTLERSVDPITGVIAPKKLMAAVKSIEGTRDALHGTNPLSRLAVAAGNVLTPLKEAPTGHGFRESLALAAVLGGSAAGGSHMEGGSGLQSALLGGVGAGAGAILPKLTAAAAFRVPGAQRYLGNQLLQKTPLRQDQAKQLMLMRALTESGKGVEAPSQ